MSFFGDIALAAQRPKIIRVVSPSPCPSEVETAEHAVERALQKVLRSLVNKGAGLQKRETLCAMPYLPPLMDRGVFLILLDPCALSVQTSVSYGLHCPSYMRMDATTALFDQHGGCLADLLCSGLYSGPEEVRKAKGNLLAVLKTFPDRIDFLVPDGASSTATCQACKRKDVRLKDTTVPAVKRRGSSSYDWAPVLGNGVACAACTDAHVTGYLARLCGLGHLEGDVILVPAALCFAVIAVSRE